MLNTQQRSRAAIIIAEMAASMTTATTEDEQHGVAYLMQEFALMLLGEGNMELAPSAGPFLAATEVDGKRRVIIVAGDAAATLLVNDEEIEDVSDERHMNLAQWLKAAGEIDLECI